MFIKIILRLSIIDLALEESYGKLTRLRSSSKSIARLEYAIHINPGKHSSHPFDHIRLLHPQIQTESDWFNIIIIHICYL